MQFPPNLHNKIYEVFSYWDCCCNSYFIMQCCNLGKSPKSPSRKLQISRWWWKLHIMHFQIRSWQWILSSCQWPMSNLEPNLRFMYIMLWWLDPKRRILHSWIRNWRRKTHRKWNPTRTRTYNINLM